MTGTRSNFRLVLTGQTTFRGLQSWKRALAIGHTSMAATWKADFGGSGSCAHANAAYVGVKAQSAFVAGR